MSLDPITAGIDFFTTIVNKVFPDKSEQEKQKIIQQMALETQNTELLNGQLKINKQEASSEKLFVSGWRPSIGWVCSLAFFWSFFLEPFLAFFISLFGFPVNRLPVLDMTQLIPVLIGILGLSGYRTIEKVKGVTPIGK